MSAAPRFEALGQSDAFLRFQEHLSRAARADRPVLLIGERGTGKELAAQRLHYLSARWDGPLVVLNCAALAEPLLDSELFGHEAGAFTGAAGRRKGRFELAHGGTLFLDEIAALTLPAQEKILRAVEYGVFERVGGSAAVEVDVRVIGATNADLPALAHAGRFKRDLLDRLGFEVLTLPPLRAREGDAELLAGHFASRMGAELGLSGPVEFSDRAWARLAAHEWPGNVRELRNVVERAVYRAGEGGVVEELDLDPFVSPWRPVAEAGRPEPSAAPERCAPSGHDLSTPLKDAVAGLERTMLAEAMRRAHHNQRRAAELLGLTYHQFRGLWRKYSEALEKEGAI